MFSMQRSHSLLINGCTFEYQRVCLPISSKESLLQWLYNQSLYPKIYWEDKRSALRIAGVGEALSFQEVPDIASVNEPSVRFFGGISFSGKGGEKFPSSYFFLPAVEMIEKEGARELIFHQISSSSSAQILLKQLIFKKDDLSLFPCLVEKHEESPSFSQWKILLSASLREIELGSLQKVVLARRTTLLLEKPLSAFFLLQGLKKNASKLTFFAFQLSPNAAFLGATPEMLYEREGSLIESEAIAGTRPKGKTEEEDLKQQAELLSCAKERREFYFVKDFIHSTLIPLCESLQVNQKDALMTTASVHHRYARFLGTLKSHVRDQDLLKALHPTPAVGGTPQREALAFIEKFESFERGWYASPIGWVSSQAAQFYVGIRSALLLGKDLHLFAGTGIVKGSIAEMEWEELEHKISPFRRLFS